MGKYIGFKMVEAKPMTGEEAEKELGRSLLFSGAKELPYLGDDPRKMGTVMHPGYLVRYPDKYTSWSPKEVFEKAYMQIGDDYSISQEMVESFIGEISIRTIGDRAALVTAILVNGVVLSETVTCIDTADYVEGIAKNVCLSRIHDRIRTLLMFLMKTACTGISHE